MQLINLLSCKSYINIELAQKSSAFNIGDCTKFSIKDFITSLVSQKEYYNIYVNETVLPGIITENQNINITFSCVENGNKSKSITKQLNYGNGYLLSCHNNIPEFFKTKTVIQNQKETNEYYPVSLCLGLITTFVVVYNYGANLV